MKFLLLLLPVTLCGYSERDLLASTLIAEAGGEKDVRAMAAVNEVIHNRAASKHISLESVILKPKQFSCWNSGNIEERIALCKKHRKFQIALEITASPITSFTYSADHYHSVAIHPIWADSMVKTVQIGNHIFYHAL